MNPAKPNKDRRESDHPVELETQFIMRLPEEPAKQLRELLRNGDSLKNRLSIQIENDMRHGEVKFDNWLMHSKIVDLPTIVESLKTIDNKSFYKTADICQMMICKEEPDQPCVEEESPTKNKKKDPYKVDKKFLWLHGITPPTKNVRKRRFRKTLKKKYVEAPEIEKEVKRLLRADNEADSFTWEIVQEDDDQAPKPEAAPAQPKPTKPDKKQKPERAPKKSTHKTNPVQSKVVDIFGGAVSDSDLEEENANATNVDRDESPMSAYDRFSDACSIKDVTENKDKVTKQFDDPVYQPKPRPFGRRCETVTMASLRKLSAGALSSEDDVDYQREVPKENMTARIEQLRMELDELKQRRQRTQNEIAGMENLALRQRFQDILHTLNQDIMYKEMEYQGMITLQNSEDI